MNDQNNQPEAAPKKTFSVAVPITGIIYVTVEAADKDEAVEKALSSDELTLNNCEEWSAHEQIVKGNVFYGDLNRATAKEE